MTVCIGAICENKKSVVISADRMITSRSPRVEFEHPASKIDHLTDHCVLLSAGQVLPATEVTLKIKEKILKTEKMGILAIANMAKESYAELLEETIDKHLLRRRRLTVKQLYPEGKIKDLPEQLVMVIDQQIASAKLDLILLVVGVDNIGGQVYSINSPGVLNNFSKIGYSAIGTGDVHALSAFIFDNYSVEFDVNKSAYICYEAKRRAELAPGVGKGTDLGIITQRGFSFLTDTEMKKLSEIYDKINKPRLAEQEKLIADLKLQDKLNVEVKNGKEN